ncbi:DEAD/DEAH box helicase family protein [Neobacillus sp. PS3-12]|uniref:DEAD/DEAH box helicase family protein n=1 Tax=Neobacillus sp. PS3-12 TaxID=3070677 RepID=UPI0027E05F07|nr:DEAD/DEAH box helicase family protein [Neobacillus sp. PS3-12]WML53333.1 DEAD/DEAH box helicase family protein [Neobacillus sp. PS3-12]
MTKVQLITQGLGNHLIEKLENASTICILTSFVMKSGVEFLKDALKKAAENGADIKICTGDYLYVTQPDALEELLSIDERISIRIWKSNGVSFHPKAYMVQSKNQECLFVGSSNLSKSALLNGVEWNLQISDEKEVFNEAQTQFLKLFFADQTVPLNIETLKEYRSNYDRYHQNHSNLAQKWSEMVEMNLMLPSEIDEEPDSQGLIADPPISYGRIQPRFAQIEALEELQKTLEEEYSKALVVMATGLGKTYLAGFFAQNFDRILFIAHREEILYQAKNSFENIMPEKHYGFYNGKEKDSNADVIFASIFTLSMKTHLEKFHPDEFDLIIVDEFHHAAADSYKRALDYFQPRFLLGITATPDRNDNKDVYAICDGNVAFRLDFLDAIQRKWLAPFKYYGVYDDTDYSQITWLGNRYDEEELLNAQLRDDLVDKILQTWKNKKQTRTLGFCSSIKQANFLSNYFNNNGFQTVSLHSQQLGVNRKKVISQLSKGEIDVIFTVDLFNEGIDIPSVDTLLFVRPTESLTVFTQQIGRGLRIYPEKEACVIIDLIGNYRNADIKLSLFDTDFGEVGSKKIHPTVPEFCEVNLDVNVINLLKEMIAKKFPRREKLLNAYTFLKHDLGRRPTYLELHLKGSADSVQYRQEFKSYVGFLEWAEELTDREKEVFARYKPWIEESERTSMAKSYKMVVLLAMLDRGPTHWFDPMTPVEVAPFFHQFLMEKEYRKRIDFSDKSSVKLWSYNQKGVSNLIATMPMTKWSGSSKGLISFENNIFKLNFDVVSEDQQILFDWTKEICEYRLHYHFERRARNTVEH